MGLQALRDAAFKLGIGDNLDPEELVRLAASHGYEEVSQVHAHGQMARRGGIMDIFSWHASLPLRIEFFDTEIESLREFDINSQVSTRRIKQAEITLTDAGHTASVADYVQPNDRLLAAGQVIPAHADGIISESADPGLDPLCAGSPLGAFEAGDFILNEARRHRFFQQIAAPR